ncbi:Peptidyl-prolyl cis-trans isomerase CYP37, chloroplastic-like protein [Drosera capensis]
MSLPLSSSAAAAGHFRLGPRQQCSSTPSGFVRRRHDRRLNPNLRRINSACNSKETIDQLKIPAPSLVSLLKDGMKSLQTAVAAILIAVQITTPLPNLIWEECSVPPANAVLYSPDTKIPRTGELALRRAIPANTNMKAIQEALEDISYLLRIPQRKPYGTMEGNVKKALKIAVDEKESILASIPTDLRGSGSELYASLVDGKDGLQALLGSIKDKDPDNLSARLAASLDTVAALELLQAPGLSFLLPQQYMDYPRLNGRATVELTIEKGDGTAFSPQSRGEAKSTATIQVVIDGYSAPLTAGNFAKLVIDGVYDGTKLNCANQAILSDNKLDRNSGYSVPLEIKPSGQFEPLYKTRLSVQDGELPVLPLSVYGAVAMAHSDVSEEFSSPNQFFFYLYDKRNSGLGGISFDEGQFSVFGYTTVGRDVLPQIKTGDIIKSVKLIQGRDRLILPNENQAGLILPNENQAILQAASFLYELGCQRRTTKMWRTAFRRKNRASTSKG